MADRPILFSAPMVLALLEGRKTQTRRVLKLSGRLPDFCGGRGDINDPTCWGWEDCDHGEWVTLEKEPVQRMGWRDWRGAYASGDRLWVKEAWRTNAMWDHLAPSKLTEVSRQSGRVSVMYEVGGALPNSCDRADAGRYRHALFMPRWASRLTLTVTDVRVERLQDISEADAVAEGVETGLGADGPVAEYETLWSHIHGPDAWDENPWVCALTFEVRRGNIDG